MWDVANVKRLAILSQLFNTVFYCRATLCTTRPTPSLSVHLSVRLSVRFVYCIKRRKHILRLFHYLIDPSFYFFTLNCVIIFARGPPPPNGNFECRWVVKNRDFRSICRLISELIQDGAICTMECQLELVCDLLNGAISKDRMTSNPHCIKCTPLFDVASQE